MALLNTNEAARSDDRLGAHLLVELYGVEPARLRDGPGLMKALLEGLHAAGFSVVRESFAHPFEGGGQGVTGFVLLAQSHAAFHSYPEFGYLALDVYSCGSHDPEAAVTPLVAFVDAEREERILRRRGPDVTRAGLHETND